MDWTRAWIVVGMLSACGPQVGVSEDDDGSDGGTSDDGSTGNGPSTSTANSGDPTSSTITDVATTDTPVLDFGEGLPNITGQHLFAVAVIIDPAHPLQW